MKHFLGLCLMLLPLWLMAQEKDDFRRFSATILAGINLAQMDGDGVAGYKKIGANVGARGGITFSRRIELSLEILYSQKGSFERKMTDVHYDLHYVEVPLEINLKEWFATDAKEREYSRIVVGGGFAYNQMVFGSYKNMGVKIDEELDKMRKHSVVFQFTGTFFFTRSLGLNIRWSRGLYSLYKKSAGRDPLIPHQLTIRLAYRF